MYTAAPQLGRIRSWLANLVGFDLAGTLESLNEETFDPALATYVSHRLDAAATSKVGESKEEIEIFMERLRVKSQDELFLRLKTNNMRLPKAPNLAKYQGPLLSADHLASMAQEERNLFEDLMAKMLRHNPHKRLDMPQVLAHGWFRYS
jgi:hypothetical protein